MFIFVFLFLCWWKFSADPFKYDIITYLKENYRLKFSLHVALNHARKKVKPQFNILYILFKEQDGYDPCLYINLCPTYIWLKEFLDGIQIFVIVVGKHPTNNPRLIKNDQEEKEKLKVQLKVVCDHGKYWKLQINWKCF